MKCKQVVDLIDRYLDGKLESGVANSLQEHIEICGGCKKEYEERKEFYTLFEGIREIKAPDNFSSSVMDAVFKLEVPVIQRQNKPIAVSYPVFRRLGMSMILTAGIMIFSMFIPPQFGGAIQSIAAEKTSVITDKTNKLSDTITDVDKSIRTFFENMSHSFDRIKEVKII